jgi:hypothetical protein
VGQIYIREREVQLSFLTRLLDPNGVDGIG